LPGREHVGLGATHGGVVGHGVEVDADEEIRVGFVGKLGTVGQRDEAVLGAGHEHAPAFAGKQAFEAPGDVEREDLFL
jgi:hypothetical protein